MKIHQVISESVLSHEIDPVRGHIAKRVDVLKPGDADVIGMADGTTYERGADGSFDVSGAHAAFMLRLPTWYAGVSALYRREPKIARAGGKS
jgi:hypothetical protein